MDVCNICGIFLILCCIKLIEASYCTVSASCSKTCYRKESYKKRCGLVFRCRKYRSVAYTCYESCTRQVCCENWTGDDCSQRHQFEKSSVSTSRLESSITALCFGVTTCPNGGTCQSPNMCSCPSGYASPNCADINECSHQNGGCAHTCSNNHGSFTCSCRSGYTLDSNLKGCIDINECHSSNGGCQQSCINNQGSFNCDCNQGYILNPDSKTCQDLNECSVAGNSYCDHICQNTIGSYSCDCNSGYSLALDRHTCEDIDECVAPTPVCEQHCHNTVGSFSCSCDAGYTLHSDDKTCTDIDECDSKNGNCLQICTNNIGSFTCSCLPGYRLIDGTGICEDIDECTLGTSGCSDICNDTDGSFVCSCPAGYSLTEDNWTCEGIDECDGVTCQNGGSCKDGHLSYKCVCASGFTGDHCQLDIDECALLNGGCQDTCTNTIGSYQCSCLDNRTLNANGASCEGNALSDSIFRRYSIKGSVLPQGCWIIELASCKSGKTLNLVFSSTSDWYLKEDGDIQFSRGIIFAEINRLAIPISVNGIEIEISSKHFEIRHGVSEELKGGLAVGKLRTENCIAADFSSSDIFEFIDAGSFLKSLFATLIYTMPNWIDFIEVKNSLVQVQDLKTELQYGYQIVDDPFCGGVPILSDHLYSVFKFDTNFTIEVYGKAIGILKSLGDDKICIIIDICQNYGATVFLVNPEKNFDVVSKFGTLFQNGLIVEARGIGISLVDGINMTSRRGNIEMWNGDHLFNYPVSERGNMWVRGDYRLDNGVFRLNGEADIFFEIPNLLDIYKSGYIGELSVFFSHQASVSLTLKMKVFGNTYEIPLDDLVSVKSDMYMSVGGQNPRTFCGKDANPPGVFLSILMSINPFRNVPILKNWVFDNTHKAYIFIVKQHDASLLDFSLSDAVAEAIDLKDEFELFKTRLEEAFERVKQFVLDKLQLLIQAIMDTISKAIDTLSSAIPELQQGNIESTVEAVNDIWQDIQNIQSEAKQFLNNAELLVDVISDNITLFIKNEIQKIKTSFQIILQDVNRQVSEYIKEYDGFGMKYHATLNVFGLKILGLDVEMVYSKTQLFRCSRFNRLYSLLEGKEAFRFLARASQEQRLGKFFKLDRGVGIGIAIALNTNDLILQFQVFASILGVRATADLFIMKNQISLYTELNVWDIFLAQVDVFAKLGKDWYQLTLNIKGRFVASVRDKRQVQTKHDSFQDSYLSALVEVVKKITNEIDKRLSQAQNILSIAQTGLTAAQDWLADKRKSLQKAHVAFDNAMNSLQLAQNKLEEAKGPFQRAITKLNEAKKNVDNLCKIRKCRKICIPGLKCKICKKKIGWVRIPYPCCKFTSCMFSFPNPICIAANILCRIVRAIAYAVLEAAKLVVRVVLLAFDIAKAALEVAEFVVDKARIVVDVAEGIFALAELGLEGAKSVLEVAKYAIEAIKITIGLAFKVFEFVIEKGLKHIIDIRNCGFEIELSTTDLPVFDVNCEINAFSLGWKTVRLRINFKNIFQSIWQAAKATIKAIINGFSGVLGRRKRRDIEFESTAVLHKFLRSVRSTDDEGLNSTQSKADNILNTLQYDEGFKYEADTDYDHRVQIFRAKCNTITHVLSFLNESFTSLFILANETYSGIQESQQAKENLQMFNMSHVLENITLGNSGISQDYALQDYNLTSTQLEKAIADGKDELETDQFLVEIFASVESASDDIDSEISAAESVQILNHWLLAMENTTNDYFNESECVRFHDCVYHAIYMLYDLYTEEDIPDIINIQEAISTLEDVFIGIFQNTSSSIENTYNASASIQSNIEYLGESSPFCAKPPVILNINTNMTTTIGSRVLIHCNVEADPRPNFTWFKDDLYRHGFFEEMFEIVNASVEDQGVYRCTAENIVANITSEDIYLYVTADIPEEPSEEDEVSSTQQAVYITLAACLGFLFLSTIIVVVSCHARRSKKVHPGREQSNAVPRRQEGPVFTNKLYMSISEIGN